MRNPKIRKVFSLSIITILIIPTLLYSQRVIPNSRVTTHLNVREHSTVNSQIVGSLSPNESAELLDSVPYWYKIRLSNGQEGFVSKAWSQIITDAEDTGAVLRLGSWNMKKLGHGSSKDYRLVAQIIESNFDILAMIEVMQKGQRHPGYDSVVTRLGTGWTGIITDHPRPNTTSGNAEFYAVVYRNALVRSVTGWNNLRYFDDNDGSATNTAIDRFDREPAYGYFEAPANSNVSGVDFMLAVYHARWADGDQDSIKAEVRNIDRVFSEMQGVESNEHDIFMLGDFNLIPDSLAGLTNATIMTSGTGSTLNIQGNRTTNLYDHLLVFDPSASSELIENAVVLDDRNLASSNLTFFQTVSDHLPIRIYMRTAGPDDD